jgi:hypothetical protein
MLLQQLQQVQLQLHVLILLHSSVLPSCCHLTNNTGGRALHVGKSQCHAAVLLLSQLQANMPKSGGPLNGLVLARGPACILPKEYKLQVSNDM